MKLIEAMKEVKRLEEKIVDLKDKVGRYSADLDYETPTYENQAEKIKEWLQSAHDSLKEALRLRIAIQNTNLAIKVPIEIGKNKVEHTIAEWILRRRLYAKSELDIWGAVSTRNLREGSATNSAGERVTVKVRMYFNPQERDEKIEEYRSEPNIIDRNLEIVNATTDLVE